MDPDLVTLMRMLADPATDPATVAFIRHTIRYVASLPPAETGKTVKRSGSA